MQYRKIIWLSPILLTFHNIEEYLTMSSFVSSYSQVYPTQIRMYVSFVMDHFSFMLISVTLLGFLITLLGSKSKALSTGMYVFVITQIIILLNAVQHISCSIWLRSYTPGVITSFFLYLPVLSYLIVRAFREGYVGKSRRT